jgi:translation initiation factor IF-2
MSETPQKMKLVKLAKEINRSKEDLIGFLKGLGIEKVTINTTLDADVVGKVLNKFKHDVAEHEKQLKKIVDFAKVNKVEISEANEVMKKEEADKKKKEEDTRLKKNLEEQKKREEDERKQQELKAFHDREKKEKEEAELAKSKKSELENLFETQKKLKEKKESQQKNFEKRRLEEQTKKREQKESERTGEPIKSEKPVESIPETEKTVASTETVKVAEQVKPETVKPVDTAADKSTPAKTVHTEPKKDFSKPREFNKPKDFTKPRDPNKPREFAKPRDPNKPRDFSKPKEYKPGDPQKQFKPKTDQPWHKKPFNKDKPNFVKPGQNKDATKPTTGKPDYKDRGKFRPNDPNSKGKFEKVTIKDPSKSNVRFKDKKESFFKSNKPAVPALPPTKDLKKVVNKDKDKKHKSDSDYEKKKKKFGKGIKGKDISQKEIDDAIRETMAKIEDDSGASARSIARKKKKKERLEQEQKNIEIQEQRKNILTVTEFVSTMELATIMEVPVTDIIKKCLDLGLMVSINQRLEKDLLQLLAEEFGYKIEFQSEYEEDLLKDTYDEPETLIERPPVVTVMGHVDHGKTSLLDYVRKANVVAGEAGGITQHIGAYKVKLENRKHITFLDTPGHEAFTAMRARGGQAADIVVLVVAADDSVMPQTVEAINHALAANVPIVIAINKVDKPEANVERIKSQLADRNILVEEWGGKYQSVEISAKKGMNIETLLDKILLESEMLALKANPDRAARGVVLESRLDKGRGSVATILVTKGTLKIGDNFVAGVYAGRVRAMFDERDKRLDIAGPSTPVQVIGFEGLPQAGDAVVVLNSDIEARQIALKRQQLKREQDMRQIKHTTLEDITNQIKEGKSVELNIILKTDVDGSGEALADSLHKLSKPGTATVKVIHKAVGQITESDVLLAEASNAVIIGFNVRPNLNARKLAEKSSVEIRIHSIIYNALDEVKLVLEGLLAPDVNEEITATIDVRQVFKVPKIGNIAGCYVQDGKIIRNHKVRLVRDGLEIYNGTISSLKRLKDDVREVESGYECGIGLENFSDIKVGDVIEGYKLIETKRKLESV